MITESLTRAADNKLFAWGFAGGDAFPSLGLILLLLLLFLQVSETFC